MNTPPMNTAPVVIQPSEVTPGPRRATPGVRRRERAVTRRARAEARREEQGPVNVSLWLPSTLFFSLLAPFAMALSPFLLLAPPRYRLSPYTVFAVGAVLLSLSGTHIEVDSPDARVRIHLF